MESGRGSRQSARKALSPHRLSLIHIFRGALDVRASDINDEMKVAAAYAIADLIPDNEITADYIIPNPFDERVAKAVAKAVAEAARKTGVARI